MYTRLVEATDVEIAWLAGLYEGEGCLSPVRREGVMEGWQLMIGMTDRDVIQKAREVVGYGKIYRIEPRVAHHKVQWRLDVRRRPAVAEVVYAIRPHLGVRRAVRADEFLAWHESPDRPYQIGTSNCPRCGGRRKRYLSGRIHCLACAAQRNARSRAG